MLYYVLGTDGKEYGPADLEELRQWFAEGRLDRHSRVRPENSATLKPAGEFEDLRPLFSAMPGRGAPRPLNRTLAVTSFVLGLLSFGLGPLTGIAGMVCSILAHHRARKFPQSYGGEPYSIAGFVLSVVGMLVCVTVVPGFVAKRVAGKAGAVVCRRNLEHVGVALGTWSIEHGGYPFSVSTNRGGSLEYVGPREDGFDTNSHRHYQAAAETLRAARTLACPGDSAATPATSLRSLKRENVTYLLQTDTNAVPGHSRVLTACPVHGLVMLTDGSIREMPRAVQSGEAAP